MPNVRNALISREEKPVYFYNEKAEKKQLGTVLIDQVQEESLSRQYFIASEDNPFKQERNADKNYKLGLGSKALSFIDPADSIEPLLNAGWQIKSVLAHRGGTEMITRLVLPEVEWADPYTYDLSRWLATDVHGSEFVSTIKASVSVHNSLHIGFCGATYLGGLYRPVCGNGAEALLLGLPYFRYSHSYWDISKAEEKLLELGYAFKNQESLPSGPVLCSLNTLGKIKSTLSYYRDEKQDFVPKSDRFENLPRDMFVFRDMPDWTLNNFIDELDVLAEHYNSDDAAQVDALSVLMAYTNAINYHRKMVKIDRGVWSAISATNEVIEAVHGIGQYLSFFGQMAAQPVRTNVYSDLNTGGQVPKRKGYKIIVTHATKVVEPEIESSVLNDAQKLAITDEIFMPKSKHVPIPPEMTEDIPEEVLTTLAAVRELGVTNMHDRKAVILVAQELYVKAAEWLELNPQFYFVALTKSADYDPISNVANDEPDVDAWLHNQ